jgi:hypothetical protein
MVRPSTGTLKSLGSAGTVKILDGCGLTVLAAPVKSEPIQPETVAASFFTVLFAMPPVNVDVAAAMLLLVCRVLEAVQAAVVAL